MDNLWITHILWRFFSLVVALFLTLRGKNPVPMRVRGVSIRYDKGGALWENGETAYRGDNVAPSPSPSPALLFINIGIVIGIDINRYRYR